MPYSIILYNSKEMLRVIKPYRNSANLTSLAFSPLCLCPACLMCVLTVILWSCSGLHCSPCQVLTNERPPPGCSDQSEAASPPVLVSAGQDPRLAREAGTNHPPTLGGQRQSDSAECGVISSRAECWQLEDSDRWAQGISWPLALCPTWART